MHNAARKLRGAAPLAWHTGLAADSLAWSSACRFQHSHLSGVGENLYMNTQAASCSDAVKMWLDEAPLYRGDYSDDVGHWTQIVWKGSTAVGLGRAAWPSVGAASWSPAATHPQATCWASLRPTCETHLT